MKPFSQQAYKDSVIETVWAAKQLARGLNLFGHDVDPNDPNQVIAALYRLWLETPASKSTAGRRRKPAATVFLNFR